MPNAMVYSKSKLLDYPSIGQLKYAFNKHKIQTIFAVTSEVIDLYKVSKPLQVSLTFTKQTNRARICICPRVVFIIKLPQQLSQQQNIFATAYCQLRQ